MNKRKWKHHLCLTNKLSLLYELEFQKFLCKRFRLDRWILCIAVTFRQLNFVRYFSNNGVSSTKISLVLFCQKQQLLRKKITSDYYPCSDNANLNLWIFLTCIHNAKNVTNPITLYIEYVVLFWYYLILCQKKKKKL